MTPPFATPSEPPSNCSSRPPTSTRLSSTTWVPTQFRWVPPASCYASAEPQTPSSAAAPSWPSSWITRRGWIVQAPSGSFLDPSGAMTAQPERAWLVLLAATAAARLQQLGISDLDRWHLVPVVLAADPADPMRRWRVHS